MSSLFSPGLPKPPGAGDFEVTREKLRRLAEASTGPQGGTLISSAGISTPILGTSATLGGGL